MLTSSNWPSFLQLPCKLPAEMDSAFTAFTAFYLGLFNKRKLSLVHSEGTATLRAQARAMLCAQLCSVTAFDAQCCRDVQFPAGAKQLNMTTLQAVVLMLFNDDSTINVDGIAARLGVRGVAARGTVCARSHRLACTQLTVEIVMRVVHPLCCSKPPCPLLKDTAGNKIDKAAVFRVNTAFDSRKHAITLPSAPLQVVNAAEAVQDDRKHQARALAYPRRRWRRRRRLSDASAGAG